MKHNHLTRDIKAFGKCPACDRTRMSMTSQIQVLDHGFVKLSGSMGGDLDIVNGARQSFDEASILHIAHCPETDAHTEWEKARDCRAAGCTNKAGTHLSKRDAGLLNFLMRQRHTSPFELVQVKLEVQAPIFVVREWMRHRTQSYNEMSARYTQLPRLFYVPARDQIREQRGKAGAYYYERMEQDADAEAVTRAINYSCGLAFDEYQEMIDNGVAKEIARLVLPVSTYTKFVASANLLNWMRFLSLRNHEHAQQEIRVYAEVIETMLAQVAPVSMECFVKHGRLGQ